MSEDRIEYDETERSSCSTPAANVWTTVHGEHKLLAEYVAAGSVSQS